MSCINKRRFTTEAEALEAIRRLPLYPKLYTYRCPYDCRGWHLSKESPEDWAVKHAWLVEDRKKRLAGRGEV